MGEGLQAVFIVAYFGLPAEFTGIFNADPDRVVKNWHLFICVAVGLWGGLVIGLVTEYFTSNRYRPVQVSPLFLSVICELVEVRLPCSFVLKMFTSVEPV